MQEWPNLGRIVAGDPFDQITPNIQPRSQFPGTTFYVLTGMFKEKVPTSASCSLGGCFRQLAILPLQGFRRPIPPMARIYVDHHKTRSGTGHKTRSVFERYNIVSDGDLREAARKMESAMTAQTATTLATRLSASELSH